MRQSKAALPHEITELKVADTIKLWVLLYTKYMEAAQAPDAKVLNTAKIRNHYGQSLARPAPNSPQPIHTYIPKKNFLPSWSISKTAITLLGRADTTVISDSKNTVLGMSELQTPPTC